MNALAKYPDDAVVRVARGLTGTEKQFLWCLTSHQQVMKTAVERTFEDMAMSRATFYRTRSSLLAKGLITETLRTRTTTEYRLVRPALEALVPSHSETEALSHSETPVSEGDAAVSHRDSAVSQRDATVSLCAPEREQEGELEGEHRRATTTAAAAAHTGIDFTPLAKGGRSAAEIVASAPQPVAQPVSHTPNRKAEACLDCGKVVAAGKGTLGTNAKGYAQAVHLDGDCPVSTTITIPAYTQPTPAAAPAPAANPDMLAALRARTLTSRQKVSA